MNSKKDYDPYHWNAFFVTFFGDWNKKGSNMEE